jgi:GT2 family glycosyltransferase
MSTNGKTMSLSVVIVSWNTKKLVLQCLESLESTRSHLPVEIILVDNASSDGTAETVCEQFPHVRLVQNESNLGFAKANNIGMSFSSGKYVCLVNSDVVVPEGCLEKMLDYMDKHPDIGMLGPKMVLPDGTIGQSCVRFPTVWTWFCNALALDSIFKGTRLSGDFILRNYDHNKIQDVDVLTGWFWMVRREASDQVGVLDDRFFMYGEDIDWPKRFHEAGWRVVFYPEAEAIHHCGASTDRAPTRFYVEMNRANLQYFRKHHGWPKVIVFWLTMLLHQILRVIGYGFVYFLKQSDRPATAFKVQRSWACIRWLAGRNPVEHAR